MQSARSQSGFTVIEALLVLGIIGMIFLMALGALPALQRSSRNNSRKQDVDIILTAVSHYELNNSANFPMACGSGIDCTATNAGSPGDYFLKDFKGKLTYYDPAANNEITLIPQSIGADYAPRTNLDRVDVYNYEKCSSVTAGGATRNGAGYNDVVAMYAIETSNGSAGRCQQL